MAKPYDATTKYLVETYPADWLALAGIPITGPVEAIDANLSTITAEADKVLRVGGPDPWLAHVEFQASRDPHLARRLLRYNILLDDRHDLPVRSIAILLMSEAEGPDLTGTYRRSLPGLGRFLEFGYEVSKIWEQPVESLLAGGLGTLPLAPVSELATMTPAEVIRRMTPRIDSEPDPIPGMLWSATSLLMGLQYEDDFVQSLLEGARGMKESSVYQAIRAEGKLEGKLEGMLEGKLEEARNLLLRMGKPRFGPPQPLATLALFEIDEIEAVEGLFDRLHQVESWEALLGLETCPSKA